MYNYGSVVRNSSSGLTFFSFMGGGLITNCNPKSPRQTIDFTDPGEGEGADPPYPPIP